MTSSQPQRDRRRDMQSTQPSATSPVKTSPVSAKPSSSARPPDQRPGCLRGLLRSPPVIASLAVLLGLLLVSAAGAAAGWSVGLGQFNATATFESGLYMLEQYNLALGEMEAGDYSLARQRLEYIFGQNPEFLDVRQQLITVLTFTGLTAEPSNFEPTATPTVDPRPKDDLIAAARALLAARDWTATIDTLLALRQADPTYHTADVDGWLYLALRNRGVENIIQLGLFEPGLYDFALAEAFGPLDGEASQYREWARLYLYGNAFWYAYPQDAAYYYGLLTAYAPNLTDASGLSAFYRYRQSLIHYADQLAASLDWCAAYEQYQLAQAARADSALQPTADYALIECIGPSDTPTSTLTFTPIPAVTLTPSKTQPGPSATPSFTSSPGPTIAPSDTPAPSDTSMPSDTPAPSDTPLPSDTPSETPTPTESPTP